MEPPYYFNIGKHAEFRFLQKDFTLERDFSDLATLNNRTPQPFVLPNLEPS